jgi:hypothetical protein
MRCYRSGAMKRSVVVALLSALAGCSAQPQYTQTSTKGAAARPKDCQFDVLTMRPAGAIEQLGIIDFQGGAVSSTGRRNGLPDTAADLREKVAPDVCRAGGDAVIAEVNGLGQYLRATVIKYAPQPDAPKQ